MDTSSPTRHFILHMMSALVGIERKLMVECTRAGLVSAYEQGGCPPLNTIASTVVQAGRS
uniref:hypothetical protein n=1 Tax=Citrobacter sp. NCU1 TaxID=2026683 RepID=UPI00313EDEEA